MCVCVSNNIIFYEFSSSNCQDCLYKDKESEDGESSLTTTPRMFLACGSEFYLFSVNCS